MVVPAFNCEPYIRRAVESLLETHFQELEILIVDDGSTDQTLDLAKCLHREHPETIRLLTHPGGQNCGVSATRNLGLECSTGELLAFLDADDYVYPDRFESAISILQANADVDGVHQLSEIVFANEEASRQWWKGQSLFGFEQPESPDEILYSLLGGRCWSTSAIVFRRSLLQRTGVFDSRFRICEDCHLWFRMAAVGNIVSGDLSRPVSAYWRHTDSAFQPSPRNRIQMINAMTAFYSWAQANTLSNGRMDRIRRCITDYIFRGVEQARLTGDRHLAWTLASHSMVRCPQILLTRRLYGNLARMALGR